MDIKSFEELFISAPNNTGDKNSKTIEEFLKAHDFSALEDIIPQLSKKDVNTIPILMALVENFNYDIAEMLCDKGLDPTRISDKGNLICAPSLEFWNWIIARDTIAKDFYSMVFTGCFALLYNSLPSDDARRTSSAQFAQILNQYHPKLCDEALSEISLEYFVLNKHIKQINTAQWEMVRGCIGKQKWEQTIFEIDPVTITEFESLIYFCKQVPMLNTLYSERFEKSKKMYDWKIENLESPTGHIKDCVLVASLPLSERSSAIKTLKENKDTRFSSWENSDLQMVVLGGRDPADAMELSNSTIQQNLYTAAGHQNFLHMMMSHMGSSCAKALRQSPEVEQHVINVLNIMDCHMFVALSNCSELSAFFKKFPKALEWTDAAGNNLGHYIAESTDLSSSLFDLLCKNPSLRCSNPAGISPRALLQSRISDPEELVKYDQMISKYDKNILQQSLKEAPDIAGKLRSRKSIKRKM